MTTRARQLIEAALSGEVNETVSSITIQEFAKAFMQLAVMLREDFGVRAYGDYGRLMQLSRDVTDTVDGDSINNKSLVITTDLLNEIATLLSDQMFARRAPDLR